MTESVPGNIGRVTPWTRPDPDSSDPDMYESDASAIFAGIPAPKTVATEPCEMYPRPMYDVEEDDGSGSGTTRARDLRAAACARAHARAMAANAASEEVTDDSDGDGGGK